MIVDAVTFKSYKNMSSIICSFQYDFKLDCRRCCNDRGLREHSDAKMSACMCAIDLREKSRNTVRSHATSVHIGGVFGDTCQKGVEFLFDRGRIDEMKHGHVDTRRNLGCCTHDNDKGKINHHNKV
jgi:hypothetical protein